jgi:hypothetical protein
MAKNKQRQQPIPTPQGAPQVPPMTGMPGTQFQLGYDPKGRREPIDIISSKDGWSEFTLSDGTVLRAKAVVLDVKRMVGQFNQEGEPIYEMQLTLVSQARVPEHSKKKG